MACREVGDQLVCSRPDPDDPGLAWWDLRGDTVWQITFGSGITDWLTVVVAALAVALAYRASTKSNHLQEALFALERARDHRDQTIALEQAEAEARSEQADRVAAWLELNAVTGEWEVVVHNRSELPVYDVGVTLLRPEEILPRVLGTLRPPATVGFGLVPPGRKARSFPPGVANGSVQVWVQGDLGIRQPKVIPLSESLFKVQVDFRDTAEREWRRDGRGVLVQRD